MLTIIIIYIYNIDLFIYIYNSFAILKTLSILIQLGAVKTLYELVMQSYRLGKL